jgi:hypothetical protein
VAFDPQSAPKADPTPRIISAATHSRIWRCTGVNVGRRKGSILGAETQSAASLPSRLICHGVTDLPDQGDKEACPTLHRGPEQAKAQATNGSIAGTRCVAYRLSAAGSRSQRANVRLGSKAALTVRKWHFQCTSNGGHYQTGPNGPLSATNGHR